MYKEVSGVRTYFHYADEGLIAEYDDTGAELKTYGYKPNSTWTTDPLFIKEGFSYYFYQNDHLGTPQKMTAINGAVVWSAKYSSFGKAAVEVETVTNNLRYPGQYFDTETGLHYNLFRYYDSVKGRYLKVDSLGIEGGINYYLYALNNPINKIDPYGLISIPDQSCISKCQVKCGLEAAICINDALYFPNIVIGVGCLIITHGNAPVCAFVVGVYSVYAVYKCAKVEMKCVDDCTKDCKDICIDKF